MKCSSKNILLGAVRYSKGFSLIEIVASLIILALICSSIFLVINRCLNSTADISLKTQAFEIARENMETLLSSNSVKEEVNYGTSKKYPHINWETIVETFEEPIDSQMWVRAVCSASYIDSQGTEQKVELRHWLTNISKRQMIDILKQMDKRERILKEQLIATTSEAAAYVNVSPETIQMWLDNGMPTAINGAFIKDALDLYKTYEGYPSKENIARVDKMYKFISQSTTEEIATSPTELAPKSQPTNPRADDTFAGTGRQGQPELSNPQNRVEIIPGYTETELYELSFEEIWNLLRNL
ncbi:MAG: type IV pilus modification PilV family protein [Planctomycetota bacterium]|jgi:prepilin-type N-terminal cleavage/methylation domain-containing protein